MRFFNSTSLGINVNDIGQMLSQYWDFLDFYNRDFSPMSFNSDFLVKAHFHEEVGRGGYFAPESGTSEAQFLMIRGALDVYGITKDTKWLNLAEELMSSAIKHLYKDMDMPDQIDEDHLWIPHWLYNASEPFIAEQYYLNTKISFKNGIGTLTADYEMREVYTVRALDAILEWENPYSDIIGKEYKIKNYTMKDKTATITLTENFTGEAYVVYADLGGPTIEHNELYEAWAIWRKLKDGESACAVDSLWWVYDAFRLLYKYTGKEYYNKALITTKNVIVEVMKVSNMNDWHVTDFSNDDCFSGSIGLYSWQNRYPQAEFIRDSKNTGSAIIKIPKGSGQVQYGKGGIDLPFNSHNTIEIKVASKTNTRITAFIAPRAGASVEERYTAYIKLIGDNVVRKYTLGQSDFIQTSNLIWDLYFLTDYSKEETYQSDNSSTTLIDMENSTGRKWRKINFHVGIETNWEGYEYTGWSQYQPIIDDGKFDHNSIPPFYLKLSSGSLNLRLKDAKGYYWIVSVPQSSAIGLFQPSLSLFTLSSHQVNDGTPSSVALPIKEYVFEATSTNATMEIMNIGEINYIPYGTNINDFVISMEEETEQEIALYYTRPLPLEGYDYTPYVAPFTVNTVNNRLDTWRGTPYTGYQCPWIWQEIGDSKGVDTVLNFLQEAQDQYYKRVGVDGFFMPLFIWDRWDSREYGEPNTFTWNGPDPNTHWGGFQYRCIETVARTYFNDPTNTKARDITYRFLNAVYTIWNETGRYPTNFEDGKKPYGSYREPHMVSLLLRTAMYYYQATEFDGYDTYICQNLIVRCAQEIRDLFHPYDENMIWNDNNIKGTWSASDNEWYIFWGGEILSALALLAKYCTSEFNIKGLTSNIVTETYPEVAEIEGKFVKVKTPIGIHKVKLVDIDDQSSTPMRIKIDNNIMCLKGDIIMSNQLMKEVRLLLLNEGNAMKPMEHLFPTNTLTNSTDGMLKIGNIKGITYKNISPRTQYDYATEGNWSNLFQLTGGITISFSFKITSPADTTLTLVFRDADGTDFGWQDIPDSVNTLGKTIYYTVPVPENAVNMMIYAQDSETTLGITDILVMEEDCSSKQFPDYFVGTVHTFDIKDNEDVIFSIKKNNGDIIDSVKLTDVVPRNLLPLRSNGDVRDEIIGNILYKRIDNNGNILPNEDVYVLDNTFGILECRSDAILAIDIPNRTFPIMDVKYAMPFADYVASFTKN